MRVQAIVAATMCLSGCFAQTGVIIRHVESQKDQAPAPGGSPTPNPIPSPPMTPSPSPVPSPKPSPSPTVVVPSPKPSPSPSPTVAPSPKPSPSPSPIVTPSPKPSPSPSASPAPVPSPVPVTVPVGSIPIVNGSHGKVTYYPLDPSPTTGKQSGADMGYIEYLPSGYSTAANNKVPLILFFSGVGETGPGRTEDQLKNTLVNGPLKLVTKENKDFPAVIIYPQADGWDDAAMTSAFLNYLLANYNIDPTRVYVTGLSLGGSGTWKLATTYPDKITAIVPMATNLDGGDNEAAGTQNLAVWAFHDAGDNNPGYFCADVDYLQGLASFLVNMKVPIDVFNNGLKYTDSQCAPSTVNSQTMTMTLDGNAKQFVWTPGEYPPSALGSRIGLTSYPSNSHDVWSNTYENTTMWSWLFSQTRAH